MPKDSLFRTLGFFAVTFVSVTLGQVSNPLFASAVFALAFAAGELLRVLVAPAESPPGGPALRRGAVAAALTWGALWCAGALVQGGLRARLDDSPWTAPVLACGLAGVLAAGLRRFTEAPQGATPQPPPDPDEPVTLEFGDTLDLHAFHPRDARKLVQDWLDHCAAEGRLEIRLIHGKGVGALRDMARKVIAAHPGVESFGPDGGNWGATAIRLKRRGT